MLAESNFIKFVSVLSSILPSLHLTLKDQGHYPALQILLRGSHKRWKERCRFIALLNPFSMCDEIKYVYTKRWNVQPNNILFTRHAAFEVEVV